MTSHLPTETTPGQWCFKIVASVDESEPQLKVRFLGEESPFPVNTTLERWSVLQHLSLDLVAVLFGQDGSILEIGTVLFTEVLEVGESTRYPHLTEVELGGEAAPRYLSKQHPRYEEMLRQLTEAATTRSFVWYVIQGATIVDTRVLSREEDDLLCRWMLEQTQRAESARAARIAKASAGNQAS